MNSFLIGSSVAIVVPLYLRVMTLENKNYSYELYSLVAPTYFGVMNVLASTLTRHYGRTKGYFLTTCLSVFIVFSVAYTTNSYPLTTLREWVLYLSRLVVIHGVIFMLVLRNIGS